MRHCWGMLRGRIIVATWPSSPVSDSRRCPGSALIISGYIPPTDGVAASLRHLGTVHLRQAHGYKLNASVGAIMAHKVSGRLGYFHASANNYRLLVSPVTVERIKDLGSLQGLVDGQSWTDHVACLMPHSAWHVVCVTNVEYYVYHELAAPIQDPIDLQGRAL